MTLAQHIIHYYRNLRPPKELPNGVQWLYPQKDPEVMKVVEVFYQKYFNDAQERKLMLGINPGRFGAGITGVNFTAARQLTEHCGIDHPFGNGSEMSAAFIYEMIEAYGGPRAFYARHFIASVCPLGFVQGGRNLNYYDDPQLYETVEPFIIRNMNKLLSFGFNRSHCVCIGGEKNFRFLSKLNDRHQWFGSISTVPHPRFIMQYKKGLKEQYVREYLEAIGR